MSYIFWGITILFAVNIIYYIVFFTMIYYWHEKKTTFVVVPLLYAFDFFLISFLVIALAVILLQYFPDIGRLFGGLYSSMIN